MSNEIVTSSEEVCSWLEAEAIQFRIDDDSDIYVTDGIDFPCFVRIPGNDRIIVTTYINTKSNATREVLLELANSCNTKGMIPRFYIVTDEEAENYFYANLSIILTGRENSTLFIRMLREFAEDFAIAIRKYDTDDLTGREE